MCVRDDISVVICTYSEDRWDKLCAAVDSVRRQSLASREIILVCNHNPALCARARDAFPGVTVVENREPSGLSGARNTGAALAGGQIVAFLDDDATAHEDWLKFLGDNYRNALVMGVGGLTLPHWKTSCPRWLPPEFLWVVGCNYLGMAPSGAPVRNLIGANMSFRREAFALVNAGFVVGIGRSADSRPFGCEETEFCIRLRQRSPGALLLTDHRAVISHFVPDSRCTFSYFMSRCYAEGVSKARVTENVGIGDGLSSELSYVTRTLPRGITRGVADAFRGDVCGLGRATAIVIGLAVAAFGFLKAKTRRARVPGQAMQTLVV